MNEQSSIEQLQKEIERLSRNLQLYQSQIQELQRQLNEISATKEKVVVSFDPPRKPLPQPAIENWSLENFIGLRLIHVVGIVVLVIGLSIGVKYAIDRNLISEGARVAAAYAAGVVLYFLSFRLKKNYAGFSAILFSGAMASLYFTTYAAFVYYQLFPFALAFAIMIGFTFYTVYKAVDYNRQEIALLGLVGAYGIPFLISKNSDRADLFFLYIAVINIGVVFLRIKMEWRSVGRLAQAITWLLFLGWAAMRFTVRWQSVGFVFMVFFFLLFSAGVLYSKWRQKTLFTQTDIYQLLLNNLALYAAVLLVFSPSFSDHSLAYLSFIFSVFIALQSYGVYQLWQDELQLQRLLNSLSLILFVLFIALQWEGLAVTLLWLLTAVLLFLWGVFRKSAFYRIASILLMGTTLVKLLLLDSSSFSPVQKIISYVVLGVLLLIVSFFYQKFKERLFQDKD